MNMKLLHHQLIEQDIKNFGQKTPIKPKEGIVAIIPANAWKKHEGGIVKKYEFFRRADRDRFVSSLLQYESVSGHPATILIKESAVTLSLKTQNLNSVTELDKEYAHYADESFKDIVYAAETID
jgi:pterin-4a-carbinolamine dehydratase